MGKTKRQQIEDELYYHLDHAARLINIRWSRLIMRKIEKELKKYSARPDAENDICFCGISVCNDTVWGIIADPLSDPAKTNKITESDPVDSRNIATEAAESNAPPTAPPEYDNIYATMDALLPPIFDVLCDTDTTSSQIFRKLNNIEVKKYVTEKIARKAYSYPHLLPLVWHTAAEFRQFEKNIKGEIYRLLLTIAKNKNAKKAAPILTSARESLNRHEISIDATLPSSDGSKDISYHDLIPDPTGDPLSILIDVEQAAAEAEVIAALSDNEKAQLISEFDTKNKMQNGELFCVDYDDESEPERAEKPVDIGKYRRKKSRPIPKQLELFAVGGVAI